MHRWSLVDASLGLSDKGGTSGSTYCRALDNALSKARRCTPLAEAIRATLYSKAKSNCKTPYKKRTTYCDEMALLRRQLKMRTFLQTFFLGTWPQTYVPLQSLACNLTTKQLRTRTMRKRIIDRDFMLQNEEISFDGGRVLMKAPIITE